MKFRTNTMPADSAMIGIFCGPDHFYKAILPLGGGDVVAARVIARKVLAEGFTNSSGDNIPASELKYCYIATRTELVEKE